MSAFSSSKSKIDPKNILGGRMGFFDETDFERESTIVSTVTSTVSSAVTEVVTQTANGVFEAVFGLEQEVTGKETETNGRFPSTGSIEFNNGAQTAQLQKQEEEMDQKQKTEKKRAFYQVLTADQEKVQREQEQKMWEEEIDNIVTNLPTEQKNELLHYQAAYKDRNIYQRTELRRKLVEERKKAKAEQQEASMAKANPKGAVGQNELIMREGNSKYGGVGDTGGPG